MAAPSKRGSLLLPPSRCRHLPLPEGLPPREPLPAKLSAVETFEVRAVNRLGWLRNTESQRWPERSTTSTTDTRCPIRAIWSMNPSHKRQRQVALFVSVYRAALDGPGCADLVFAYCTSNPNLLIAHRSGPSWPPSRGAGAFHATTTSGLELR